MIIWVIGLAGAGKTTIGSKLFSALKVRNPATVFLDGDHVREIMGNDLGHTLEDRKRNAERIIRLCQFMDRQNIDVVCSILSIFPEHQRENRTRFKGYFEIFIDVPMKVLIERNQKGLYVSALKGEIKNVVGVDIPFSPPAYADYTVNNGQTTTDFNFLITEIVQALEKRGILSRESD